MDYNKIEHFDIFKQEHKDDCWIASCKMTIDYLKKLNYKYDDLIEKSKLIPDQKKGTGEGIIELLKSAYSDLKYQQEMGILEIKDYKNIIIKNIDNEYPVIIGLPHHAVVVIGYNDLDKKFIIANPLNKKEEMIEYNTTISDICYYLN